MKKGFEPVFDKNSEILILGSFPSVQSREISFYYGNPRNRFWSMLASVFCEDIPNIAGKKQFLLNHKIALWDVIEFCDIKGSSDSDITAENSKPVDLDRILDVADIKKIICNGKKSHELFQTHFPNCKIPSICLPSTSPANAWWTRRGDKDKWRGELCDNERGLV